MITQAIHVRFLGPTNFRGSRYIAKCSAGIKMWQADHALNPSENARKAAEALRDHLQWNTARYGDLVGGGLPDGSYVFVFSDRPRVAREALASVRRMVPWLARMVADSWHKDCANPNDAVQALNEACSLLNQEGISP